MHDTSISKAAEPTAKPADFHDPLAGGFGVSREGRFLFWVAVAFSTFQIVTALHLVALPSVIVRATHVGFLIALAFPLIAMSRKAGPVMKALAYLFAAAGFSVAIYQYLEYTPLILRAGDPNTLDLVFGVVALLTLFTAGWVVMGPALPIICGIFLAYCLFGEYLPSPLNHRGYDFEQVIDHMAYGTEGIYGIPTLVSSTYIFLFILFGSFLEHTSAISIVQNPA